MKIEVFSDFTCPFCYIGKRELERAIDIAGYTGLVEIEYKAFQLDPNIPKVNASTFYEAMAKKYDVTLEEVKDMVKGIAVRAMEVGLDYEFAKMPTSHTEKAHRLAKSAIW